MLKKLLNAILAMTSAELALASFLAVSLLGACALMIAEQGHTAIEAYTTHHDVIIRTIDGANERQERHTTVAFAERTGLRFVDAWFTSTSALCVTGLTVVDFSQFTVTGQILVLFLMQIGGLGIFVFTSILVVSIFRGVEHNASFRSILASTVDCDRNHAAKMLR